jgi:hypothetical protein
VKFVNLDFSAGGATTTRALPFEPAAGTIAVAPSLFKTLEDTALGSIDEVLRPELTRRRLVQAFDSLENKRDQNPPKKHGNIPL